MDKKRQWIIDHTPILGTLQIKELYYPHTPVAMVAVPQGDWISNPRWKKRALTNAHLLSSAPVMYDALIKVKAAMNLEHAVPDMDKLYETVVNALKEASYESDTSTT